METIDCPKCEHEHKPSGNHGDDSGEHTCENCGFVFNVVIEYDPSYWTFCLQHEFDDWETRIHQNQPIECRFCIHCKKCEIKE
jgi:transposase-like protein